MGGFQPENRRVLMNAGARDVGKTENNQQMPEGLQGSRRERRYLD